MQWFASTLKKMLPAVSQTTRTFSPPICALKSCLNQIYWCAKGTVSLQVAVADNAQVYNGCGKDSNKINRRKGQFQ